MLIDPFYHKDGREVSFTRQQASDFAKNIADDFNPLHHINAKRFCVPGDLLFSMVLARYGVSKHMHITFSGMVTEKVPLTLPEDAPLLSIKGNNGKEYLSVEHSGDNSQSCDLIDQLTKSYVTFSGHTFTHIFMPMMAECGVMINPQRPIVMYKSMLIELDRVDLADIRLEFDKEKTRLDVDGKRGNLCVAFNLKTGTEIVGRGEKYMVVSGLQTYEKDVMDKFLIDYKNV